MLPEFIAVSISAFLSALVAGWLTRVAVTYIPNRSWWLQLRAHIPIAAAFGAGAVVIGDHPAELVGFAAAGVGCALLVVVDLSVHRLPDQLVAVTWGVLCASLALAAALESHWADFGRSLLASVILLAGYFMLALIAPSGMGLGDVKFAAVIGALLGWFGWGEVALGTLLAFVLNGFLALTVIIVKRGGVRTEEVPFGPSMILGAMLALALTA